MTALSAITASCVALYPAELSEVVLVARRARRPQGADPIDLNAVQKGERKDVTMQAGDVLQVPPSPIRLVPYGFFWLVTNVVRVGAGVSLTAFDGEDAGVNDNIRYIEGKASRLPAPADRARRTPPGSRQAPSRTRPGSTSRTFSRSCASAGA